MTASSRRGILSRLARLYGIQTAYYDISHHRQQASTETLLGILKAMGASVYCLEDAPGALRERYQALWRQVLEPVIVAWDNKPPTIMVRLPSQMADMTLTGYLTLETGEQHTWKWEGSELPVSDVEEIECVKYIVKHLTLPLALPWGYHRFILETPGKAVETLIIAAPLKAYNLLEEPESRIWGVFLPLYAMHTQKSWGGGDFSDLQALTEWVAQMGSNMIATLPLLPTFLNDPFEPSPYAPVSRLMWNEFYINIDTVPELQNCPLAKNILSSSSFQEELEALRSSALINYKHQMALKRKILEELCRCCFAEASDRLANLQHFIEDNPSVEDYACYRATHETMHTSWTSWPQPLKEGNLKEGDYNEEIKRYDLYIQWLAQQQFDDVSKKMHDMRLEFYLDFPLGVHSEGYDVWREHTIFATEASGGAPPDIVFTKGQNWEFPPLHPERLRQQSYKYYISCLQHHLRHAGILRIDHVMGLHRLFWIPKGMEADQGAYVSYRPEEFYAILTLESQRSKTVIVGEDLGIVPSYVRQSMNKYGLHRMYVLQYELMSDWQKSIGKIPTDVVASMDTHDMPPFAAFWQGLDIEDRLDLKFLDKTGAFMERRDRESLKKALVSYLKRNGWLKNSSPEDVLKACWTFLGASTARVVLVNLEDLWLEKESQNVPATGEKRNNWQKKARFALETFSNMSRVNETLRALNQLRKYSTKGG